MPDDPKPPETPAPAAPEPADLPLSARAQEQFERRLARLEADRTAPVPPAPAPPAPEAPRRKSLDELVAEDLG